MMPARPKLVQRIAVFARERKWHRQKWLRSLGIPLLVLSTGVERVAIHFRQPDQQFLDRLSVTEARRYLAEGEFPKGSMGPKVEAAITFLEQGGSEVLITSPANLEQAFAGSSGTRIVADAAFASVSPSGS